MSANRPSLRHRMAGFTLLEILVVMALLSAIMLALGAALRTMAQSEVRVDQRLGRADELRVSTAFMRTILSRVSLRRVTPPGPPGSSLYLFSAAPDAVAWVGVMPARHGAGGRHFFRLAVEPVEGRTDLVLRFAPVSERPDFPDWSAAEARTLVSDVTSIALRYEDGLAQPAQWTPLWRHAERLPERVALQIATATGPWPEIIVPMRGLPASQSGIGGFVFGGTR